MKEMPDFEGFSKFLEDIPDEYLSALSFSVSPWQYDPDSATYTDPDFKEDKKKKVTREELADECWDKLHANPQVNTAVRGKMGRLTGLGFETTSGIAEIQDVIEEIELDQRNRLYNYYPKYVARSNVEGELYLCLTCHASGFIEVDFTEPKEISGGGDDDSGIIFHPTKTTMPLFYNLKREAYEPLSRWGKKLKNGYQSHEQIPSIFIARYPSLVNIAKYHQDYDRSKQQASRNRKRAFKSFGGYNKFIVAWDKSFITRRAISYLRTILEWLNHYENLKKYEIDHKKSAGAYVWWIEITDARAFRQWLKLTDAERKKTGIMAKKTPGSTLVTPPGLKLQCINPSLTQIKDQDPDILQMVTSGLDEAVDVTTGTPSGTFSSVKASRGPMTDRTSDEVAYFTRFLRHDFWGGIFFLKAAMGTFKETIEVEEARSFKIVKKDVLQPDGTTKEEERGEPVFEKVKRRPETLIDFSFPVSETQNLEGRTKAVLGAKHGPISETLGISKKSVAELVGIGGYARQRLVKATEDRILPKLVYTVDAESIQEKSEGEPGKSKEKNLSKIQNDDTFKFDMSKKDWIEAWKKDPHWAKSMSPSPLAKDLVKKEKENKTIGDILEVGCGNGRDSIYFAKQGHKVVGIDLSPEAIKIAEKNRKKEKLDNISFEVGDVENLKFDDVFFDAIYSLSVLHDTKVEESVSEISRVLKKKGIALLYLYYKTTFFDQKEEDENRTEIHLKIGEFEKILSKNDLRQKDKYTTEITDEDEDGKHKHFIVIYFLQKK